MLVRMVLNSEIALVFALVISIFGAIAVVVYIFLMKKDITIKMPDTVPPAVSKAFTALIPGIAALYVVAIINWAFTKGTGQFFGDWLSQTIQAPLLHAGQSAGMVILVSLLVQIFWFFGNIINF